MQNSDEGPSETARWRSRIAPQREGPSRASCDLLGCAEPAERPSQMMSAQKSGRRVGVPASLPSRDRKLVPQLWARLRSAPQREAEKKEGRGRKALAGPLIYAGTLRRALVSRRRIFHSNTTIPVGRSLR